MNRTCSRRQSTPPFRAYAALIGLFGAPLAVALRSAQGGKRLSLFNLVLLGTTTHKITRVLATDRVTSVLRKPFTEGGESDELQQKPAGGGMQRAVGELVTCPYCLGPWVATGLVTAHSILPRWIRPVLGIFSAVAISDLLHHVTDELSS